MDRCQWHAGTITVRSDHWCIRHIYLHCSIGRALFERNSGRGRERERTTIGRCRCAFGRVQQRCFHRTLRATRSQCATGRNMDRSERGCSHWEFCTGLLNRWNIHVHDRRHRPVRWSKCHCGCEHDHCRGSRQRTSTEPLRERSDHQPQRVAGRHTRSPWCLDHTHWRRIQRNHQPADRSIRQLHVHDRSKWTLSGSEHSR